MSFDIGGFLGGVIGTIGAFGIALWTFRHAKKKDEPIQKKRQLLIGLKVYNILFYYPLIVKKSDSTMDDIFRAIRQHIMNPLEELLPDGIEAGGEVAKILIDVKNTIVETIIDGKLMKMKEELPGEEFTNLLQSKTAGEKLFDDTYQTILPYLKKIYKTNEDLIKFYRAKL